MLRAERLDEIRGTLRELAQAQTTAALCVSELEELVATDVAVEPSSAQPSPRADESKFCVVLGRRTCHLGHTNSFRLFVRLLRRTNHYISYDHLLRDVWHSDVKSPETIRSAIRQLKTKLECANMRGLARAIKGQGRHYGLMLHRSR
jgi:DNA-binding response OmpR family regulator